MNGPLANRAGPLLGALLVVVATVFAVTPAVPGVTAADPTPAPTSSPDPGPTPDPSAGASPDPSVAPSPDPSPAPSADPSASPAPIAAVPGSGLRVTHAWVDDIDPLSGTPIPGAVDTAVSGVERFHVYEVRFQVLNDSDATVRLTPTLEVGLQAASATFAPLPTADAMGSAPFYVSVRPSDRAGPHVAGIRVADLRIPRSADPAASPIEGVMSFGRQPAPAVDLGPHTFTEIGFTARATASAAWQATYVFRLAPDLPLVDAGATASVTLRAKPTIELTPGQKSGQAVGAAAPLSPDVRAPRAARTAASASGPVSGLGPTSSFTSPHLDLSLVGDTCAACHSGHQAQGPQLLRLALPQSNLCFSCHAGTGALSDVKAQYVDPAVPANDATTSSYYSHPATTLSDHTTDRQNEFGGRLDRHAACADCHQPHLADPSAPTQTSAGWTASGPIRGASGVAVVNGSAGSSPTYTWTPTSTLEYQLCFKCHSGFTQLPAQDPAHPSRWELDKSVELNPSNASYHPIEAPGTNATAAMATSLSGTSPFKLWTFSTGSVIRCVSCHGDASLATPASPPSDAAQLAPHAGPNRGLLMAPYRDRTLKPQGQDYTAADFALCYQCHAESPMVDLSGDANSATNFNYHGVHLNLAFFYGVGGTDIDVAGAGQGNLVCSECHFRIHGTTYAVNGQPSNPRLINFAPDVQPYRGTLRWSPTATGGTCTLTCHGVDHPGWSY